MKNIIKAFAVLIIIVLIGQLWLCIRNFYEGDLVGASLSLAVVVAMALILLGILTGQFEKK